MGWTGINTKKSFNEVFKDEFAEQLYSNVIIKYQIVEVPKSWYDDEATEEAEVYCAWRCKNNSITCVTITFKRFDNEVIYKVQEESMGPYMKTKCPKDVFDILSSIDKLEFNGYANKWRERQ